MTAELRHFVIDYHGCAPGPLADRGAVRGILESVTHLAAHGGANGGDSPEERSFASTHSDSATVPGWGARVAAPTIALRNMAHGGISGVVLFSQGRVVMETYPADGFVAVDMSLPAEFVAMARKILEQQLRPMRDEVVTLARALDGATSIRVRGHSVTGAARPPRPPNPTPLVLPAVRDT